MEIAARAVLILLMGAGLAACGGDDLTGFNPGVSDLDPVEVPDDPIPDEFGDDNLPPSAAAAATPSRGAAPLAVTFTAAASTDSDGAIVEYRWDFGDGSEASGLTVGHSFARPGEHAVRLTVVDDDGAFDSTVVVVSVEAATDNLPPAASFSADPRSGAAPLVVSFDATASADSDGGIVEYHWDFGDGSEGRGATAGHSYSRPGVYLARLTVVDNDGAISTASTEISVTELEDVEAGGTGAVFRAAAPGLIATGAVGAGARQVLRLQLTGGEMLQLAVDDHMAAAPARNDLDMFLFQPSEGGSPRYVASSVGGGEREALRVPRSGEYHLLIEAAAGSSSYRLWRGSAALPTPARLEDAFIANQLIAQARDGVLPALAGLEVAAGAPERPLLLELAPGASVPADGYWRGEAPSERYATVRALKRLRNNPGLLSVDLNHIRFPNVRARQRQPAGWESLGWPAGLAAPDPTGALPSYQLIQWLRAMAGLSNDVGAVGRPQLIELRLPQPTAVERAALTAATEAGATVIVHP